jgi:DNA-directed RNA polymerase beta subunit
VAGPLVAPKGLFDDGPSTAPAAPAPVTFRRFDDIPTQRTQIYDNALRGVRNMKPVENTRFRLEVAEPRYDGDYAPSIADEKKAILGGTSLRRSIKAKVRLIDKATGTAVDEQDTTLAHVPHLNSRGLFINNGTIWNIRNQQRLRPGVFVMRQQNGNLKAQFNVKPGSGRQFNVEMDPGSGVFKLSVGQSGVRLYPLLREMGVDDDALKAAWGPELFSKNWRPKSGNDLRELDKVVQRLGRTAERATPSGETLKKILERSELDEETTAATLGKEHTTPHISLATVLQTTKKILSRARDEVDDDNRDAQPFQSFHSAEDFFEERLRNDRPKALQKLLWNATKTGKLSKIPGGLLDRSLQSIFNGSGLAAAVEDVNPMETMDQRQMVTRLGEGGISSNQSVARDTRGVQPSYFGFIDPIRAPEGQNIGVDMRVTDFALKGSDNKLYLPLRDPRTGKTVTIAAREAADVPIAFPGEFARAKATGATTVRVMKGDNLATVPLKDVNHELPSSSAMFSRLSNLVPMLQGSKSQRSLMGARMISQALPLRDAEAPLVQSANGDGLSQYTENARHVGAVVAKEPGRVVSVSPDHIEVVYAGGRKETHQLYNNYPLARKTSLHSEAVVKPGEPFKPGQTLAKSNFTDASGTLAPGRNMRVAYMVGEGGTYEDGFVISESAAKKLTSQHHYKFELEKDDTIHSTKLADFKTLYPQRYTPAQLQNFDEDGCIKEGATVNPEDPLILAIQKRPQKPGGTLTKTPRSSFNDGSQVWDNTTPGVVTDVVKTKNGIKVSVKSFEPMTPASKLSARYGNKGVISRIVPDGEMPHGADGKPVDVLVNALGVISRGNPAVLAETLLGKVARKTGKPYVLKSFDHEDLLEFALGEAKKHGVEETETLTDPKTGRQIPGVFTGDQFMMRLHHTAESKMDARDTGGYGYDDSPAKGGPQGNSKRISLLDTHSLLSYGATAVLKDAKLIRGQRNDDYWRNLKLGVTPQAPLESGAHRQFLDMLRGSGVNVRDRQGRQQVLPMTDADTDALARHEILNSGTFDFDSMKPVEGGLFDTARTGGADGRHFAKIVLPSKIPNPIMEEPIIRILGLTAKKFEAILGGTEDLKKGPEAIEDALSKINVDREIENRIQDVKTGNKSNRDAAVRTLNYLTGLRNMGVKPADLMISKLPVLPPKMRPVMRMGKMDIINDANYLYHDLMESRQNLVKSKEDFGADGGGEEYLTMYRAAKAVTGLGDPVNPKHVEQGIKGILAHAIGVGASPKAGRFQRKVIGQSVDNVGRGTITPDPELDMDQVAIPEDMAWELFKPFVIRRLVRNGYQARDAVKALKEKQPAAMREMMAEMKERPVYWNRAPALHRFNYVGAWARLSKGKNIAIPQAVQTGSNSDFDGDQVNVHIPVGSDAQRDVIDKMMPSKNLWHPGSYDIHLKPEKDYLAGLFLATTLKEHREPRRFSTKADAYRAYMRGELGVADPVIITELEDQKS